MEHINVKNKIITLKDKSAASKSFDLQNSGKEKKETNLQSHTMMWVIWCLVHKQIKDDIVALGICAVYFNLILSL